MSFEQHDFAFQVAESFWSAEQRRKAPCFETVPESVSKEGVGRAAFCGGGAERAGAASATKPSKRRDAEIVRRRRFIEDSLRLMTGQGPKTEFLGRNVGLPVGEGKRKFCKECIEGFSGGVKGRRRRGTGYT